jgi:hypothetical protein
MTEKLTDALYEETLARIADGHIDLGGTIGLRRWCDGSGPCAVETEPHGHWRGGVSVSTREVVLRLVRERDEARAALAKIEVRANVFTVPVLPINAEDERIVEDLIRQHKKEKP